MKSGTVYFESRHQSGNIYFLLGLVHEEMRSQKRMADFKELQARVFSSGSYDDALAVIREYVDLVDEDGLY